MIPVIIITSVFSATTLSERIHSNMKYFLLSMLKLTIKKKTYWPQSFEQ